MGNDINDSISEKVSFMVGFTASPEEGGSAVEAGGVVSLPLGGGGMAINGTSYASLKRAEPNAGAGGAVAKFFSKTSSIEAGVGANYDFTNEKIEPTARAGFCVRSICLFAVLTDLSRDVQESGASFYVGARLP
jgi:hypothetical protein